MPTQLLTLRETAERLREHEQTTRKRLRSGEIKGTRKGTGPRARWYVTESALEHYIRKVTS